MIALAALAVVYALMLVEWRRSLANERALRAGGAREPPADVHRTMAWAYPASFLAMTIEGAWSGPPAAAVAVTGAGVFIAAKALKAWAIVSLGGRWTFRVLVLPDAPLVHAGPYAYLRHPNYVGVLGELAGFAVGAGAPLAGLASLVVFGALLLKRVAVEERAIGLRPPPSS